MTDTKNIEAKTEPKSRNKRIPFGVPRSKLSVPNPIEGYHLRWVNDIPGRLLAALEGGYSFVEPNEVGYEEDKENKVKRLVDRTDNGEPLYAYLMKLALEFYHEDKALKSGQLDQLDNAIRKGQTDRSSGDNRYVPDGGISIKTK